LHFPLQRALARKGFAAAIAIEGQVSFDVHPCTFDTRDYTCRAAIATTTTTTITVTIMGIAMRALWLRHFMTTR
jgi:hypothetical protein